MCALRLPSPCRHPPSAPGSLAWRGHRLLAPATSARQLPVPAQPVSADWGPPLANGRHHSQASGWTKSPAPKNVAELREGLPHSLPQSHPGSRLAQVPGQGVGGLPGTLPCQASPFLLLWGEGDLSTPCTANKTSTRLQRPRQHISAVLQGDTEAGSERG